MKDDEKTRAMGEAATEVILRSMLKALTLEVRSHDAVRGLAFGGGMLDGAFAVEGAWRGQRAAI